MKHSRLRHTFLLDRRGLAVRVMAVAIALCCTQVLYAQDIVENTDVYHGQADITAPVRVILKPGFRAVAGCNVRVFSGGTTTPGTGYTPVDGGVIAAAALSDHNYIHTTVLRDSVKDETQITSKERIETVQYFDGLGRPAQIINIQGSPLKKDIVQPISYDQYGREDKKYLPYVATIGTGVYADGATAACVDFYTNEPPTGRTADTKPYADIIYEASPLNRVLGSQGIGQEWASNPTAISYQTNTSGVNNWDVVEGATVSYTSNNYAASQLYVVESSDEDGNTVREYKNKLGQVVCKEAMDGSTPLSTYYIYDDFGLLRCVVPPKAGGPGDTELCYYYTYDERRRMIKKELPGAGPVYMVYDERDRLVMTQDGELAAQGKWMVTLYDQLNRPVITGMIGNAPSTVEADFEDFHGNVSIDTSSTNFGYDLTGALPAGYSLSKANIQTATYYDGYAYLNAPDYNTGDYAYADYPHADFTGPSTDYIKGQVTGTLTRVIDGAISGGDNDLLSVSYYDDYGRVIRTISDNHKGGKDIAYSSYSFTGEPLETVLLHKMGTDELKLATTYDYDHQGRLLTEKVQVGTQAQVTVAAYTYNELGELATKYLHGNSSGQNFNQQQDYTYNVRGWVRSINQPGNLGNDLFALDLRYTNPGSNDNLTANARYNGNIAEMRWHTTGKDPQGYGFAYDNLNRLTASTYGEGTGYNDNANHFNTSYTYDDNGNFKTLVRYAGNTLIDQLTYRYENGENSNRLLSVIDIGTIQGYAPNSGQYGYDSNGNMDYDPSKEITIAYNHLNLPQTVDFVGSEQIAYVYDAVGTKLRKEVSGQSVADNNYVMDYIGPFIYEDNNLKAIFTGEGRIVPVKNSDNSVLYKYEYNLKDHLGNVRVVFGGHSDGRPELMQTTGYYPFGMVMAQANHYSGDEATDSYLNNRFLYNGKERENDDMGGTRLDWYDYGMRFYDPQIGRFIGIDPIIEDFPSHTPYNYAFSNPVTNIDLWGLQGTNANNVWGTMTIHSNVKPDAGVLAGHAWVEFKGNNGTNKTLSLWGNQGSREFFANKEQGKTGVVSRTVNITNGDVKTINDFNSDPENVDWNAGNTCAGYSGKLWNTVTGENLDAANAVGIPNPATLSESIIDANGGTNTNTNNQNNNGTESSTSGSNSSTSSNSSANSGSSTPSSSSSSTGSSTGSSLGAASSGGTGEITKQDLKKYTDTVLQ